MPVHYEDIAKELVGNWMKFQSFGWHDRPEDSEKWCIIYLENRDSGLRDQSNSATIRKALTVLVDANPDNENDVSFERHGHFACGWLEAVCIRVYRADGSISPIFKAYAEMHCALESYPILNEMDYSEREYKATFEGVRMAIHDASRKVDGDTSAWEDSEDVAEKVYTWLSENEPGELESRDDQGGYPSQEATMRALEALGLIEFEEDDN